MRSTLHRVSRADARLFQRLVGRRSPVTDRVFWTLTKAANRALLWLGIAGLLAATRNPRAQRAAARGVVAMGLSSATVNGPLKLAWRRGRPVVGGHIPTRGLIRTPRSSSFPSGHTASAFAFATSTALEFPPVAVPIGALAVGVAYSRVHTGVHYPGDVVAGAAVGTAAGIAAGPVVRALEKRVRTRRLGSPPPRSPAPRRAVLLYSPHAGSAHRLQRSRDAMAAAGIDVVEEIVIEDHERLAGWVSRAHEEPVLVVAAGGDGTVGTAADHVANSEAVLGVLPLGTANDFARSIGVPMDPVKAVQLLATGDVLTIDAGRFVVADQPARHFVHAATAGMNVSFAKLATKASLRRRFGRLTYAIAGARALRDPQPFQCDLHYEGNVETLELVHLAVVNAPVFGGFLGIRVSGASLDDQTLDVIAVEALPVRKLILAALHPILGIKRPISRVRTFHVAGLRVHTPREQPVALDGEVLGKIPAGFEVAAEALRVVTPPDFGRDRAARPPSREDERLLAVSGCGPAGSGSAGPGSAGPGRSGPGARGPANA